MLTKFVLLAVPAVASGNCDCIFQGQHLNESIYNNYPSNDPGKYNTSAGIKLYGTTCAAWDQMTGMPWSSDCPSNGNWSAKSHNWCQQPWCYVDKSCSTGVASSVFNGSSVAFYSYLACGSKADCYSGWPANCPYDPHNDNTYKTHKTGACECIYHGQELSSDLYTNYPSDNPGKYKNHSAIQFYGTSCAAWDQVPGTPWADSCPITADWCHETYNWCQAPWCYVGANCTSGVKTDVFNGSTTAHFSYDTCLGTPDCYSKPLDAKCPWDGTDNGWYTAKDCTSTSATGTQSSDASSTPSSAPSSAPSGENETQQTSGAQQMSGVNLLLVVAPILVAGHAGYLTWQ